MASSLSIDGWLAGERTMNSRSPAGPSQVEEEEEEAIEAFTCALSLDQSACVWKQDS